MKKLDIRIDRLNNGQYCASLGLGTIGWNPFPWTITFGNTAARAEQNFRKAHAEKIKQYEQSQENL